MRHGGMADFIEREMQIPFSWENASCAAMADRRVQEVIGRSPLAEFGRGYNSVDLAEQWMAQPGGLIRAVKEVMRSCGFKRTSEPEENDVGLIYTHGKVCVAVFDGLQWFSRDADGFIGADVGATIVAWQIEPRGL